jgi:hypothetical protein
MLIINFIALAGLKLEAGVVPATAAGSADHRVEARQLPKDYYGGIALYRFYVHGSCAEREAVLPELVKQDPDPALVSVAARARFDECIDHSVAHIKCWIKQMPDAWVKIPEFLKHQIPAELDQLLFNRPKALEILAKAEWRTLEKPFSEKLLQPLIVSQARYCAQTELELAEGKETRLIVVRFELSSIWSCVDFALGSAALHHTGEVRRGGEFVMSGALGTHVQVGARHWRPRPNAVATTIRCEKGQR